MIESSIKSETQTQRWFILKKLNKKIHDILKNNCITKQEYHYLTESLESPRTPLFYRLPKIHKIFYSFSPLRPIVYSFNSCTCNLSKFVDPLFTFQAFCKSPVTYRKKKSLSDYLIANQKLYSSGASCGKCTFAS